MSSPALSRSSSPSLESVSDFSDVERPVSPTKDVETAADIHSAANSVPIVTVGSEELNADNSIAPPREYAVAQAFNADCNEPRTGSSGEKIETVQTIANVESIGVKHERYFFTADFVTFLVEGTAYRVHSAFFTRFSPYWAERLASAECDESPINLDDVHKNEMDAFLSTLYPTPESEIKSRTYEDWEAILRLATMWKFEEKRKLAITALEPLASSFQKLCLARAHDIEGWLHPAFVALCLRPSTLSYKEAKALSLRDVMHIMSAREALYKGRTGSPSHEDVSAYVAKHIHASTTPIPAQPSKVTTTPRRTQPASIGHLFSALNSSPVVKLSANPTIEEKQAFAKLFSTFQYQHSLRAVQSGNIKAFCGLLADFSTAYQSIGSFDIFLVDVLIHGASHRPFIPIGTQLLKTFIQDLPLFDVQLVSGWPLADPSSKISQTKAKAYIAQHRDGMRKFWSSVGEALVKYGDFTLAMAHTSLSTNGSQSGMILGLGTSAKGDSQVDYEQKSANLRAFFGELVEARLL